MNTDPGPRRELALIQLWETLATIARAAFFFLATPVLLLRLSPEGYGLLAMALSVMACVTVLDFGMRPVLRVALSSLPRDDEREWPRVLAEFLGAFLGVQAIGGAIAIIGARSGWWSRGLGLGAGGDSLLVAAMLGSTAFMISLLILEPLAATRRLSLVKAASFIGNALAVPVVIVLAKSGASAQSCFLGYVAALTIPNLLLAMFWKPRALAALLRAPASVHPRQLGAILFKGRWFTLYTAQWLARGYLLTFLISALFGTAEAGLFFILLKLSELLSVFGANTSETSIAELAASHVPLAERQMHFAASYRASLAASVAAFAGLASVTPVVIERWFQLPSQGSAIGVLIGGFGLAGGFNRVVAAACMGLGLARSLALWGMVETGIVLGGFALWRDSLGVAAPFAAGALAALALLRPARAIAAALEVNAARLWARPAFVFLVGVALSAGLAVLANSLASWPRWAGIAAACACGGAAATHYIRQLHVSR